MTEPPIHAAAPATTPAPQPPARLPGPDLTTPRAACPGRRVLEIAAAGRHHLALIGPNAQSAPLARQLLDLLPDLDAHMSGQLADLYRAAGLTRRARHRPPWQEADQSLSIPALVGGARRPGAVSLAHRGVLFADHAAQWSAGAVNALVHVLDNRRVTLLPFGVVYPADLQLVLASTTCPYDRIGCDCPTPVHRRYLGRSIRLLDRADVRLPLPSPAAGLSGVRAVGRAPPRVALREAWTRGVGEGVGEGVVGAWPTRPRTMFGPGRPQWTVASKAAGVRAPGRTCARADWNLARRTGWAWAGSQAFPAPRRRPG